MEIIKINKRAVAYRAIGDVGNPAIVLLHGFCEDSRMWEDWLELLPKNFRYLLIDLPGAGGSELIAPLNMERMADVVQEVLTNLNIQQCTLVGHSMGGYVSLAFAEKYGDNLDALCLFHSQPHADSEEKKINRLKSIEFIKTNGHLVYVRQLIPKLFAYDYTKGYPMEVNKMIYYATELQPTSLKAALEAMRIRPDRREVLKNVKCPVQFMIGKLDGAVSIENSLSQTHLPNISDIRIFPAVGHMGMFEAPRKTAKAFKEFLQYVYPGH